MTPKKILSFLFVILVIGSALVAPVIASGRDHSHAGNNANNNAINDHNTEATTDDDSTDNNADKISSDKRDEDRENYEHNTEATTDDDSTDNNADEISSDKRDEDRENTETHIDDRDYLREKVRSEMEASTRVEMIDTQNRYLFDKGSLEARLLAMDTIIDYAKNNGINASELIDVRDEYKDLIEDQREASEEGEFDDYMEHRGDLSYVDSYFKKLVSEKSELRGSEFESTIKEALDKGQNKSEEYRKKARDKYRNSAIEKMDDNIRRCDKVIEKTKESGLDASELEYVLGEIKTNYTRLDEAFANEDYESIPVIIPEIKDNLLEFRVIAESLKKYVIIANLDSHIVIATNVTTRAGDILTGLESAGISVSKLRTDLSIANEHVSNARINYDNGSMEIASNDLRNARIAFQTFIAHLKQTLLFKFSDAGVIENYREGNGAYNK